MFHFLKIYLFIYLRIRLLWKGGRFLCNPFTLQIGAVASAGSGQSPGTSSESLSWAQVLGLCCAAAFHRLVVASWIRSGAAETRIGAYVGCQYQR